MIQQINQFFTEISFYLEKEANENGACVVLSNISYLASQFRPEHICEAKNFQENWQKLKPAIKELALTSDFKKYDDEIQQSLEEILEPEKWEDKIPARKNGSIELELTKNRNFFIIMSSSTKASV